MLSAQAVDFKQSLNSLAAPCRGFADADSGQGRGRYLEQLLERLLINDYAHSMAGVCAELNLVFLAQPGASA